MTEQQKKEIEELKSWDEWEAYVKNNNIDAKVRIYDPELGDVIHNKGFSFLDFETLRAPISPETQAHIDEQKKRKYDPNQKGFRQLIVEQNKEKENGN